MISPILVETSLPVLNTMVCTTRGVRPHDIELKVITMAFMDLCDSNYLLPLINPPAYNELEILESRVLSAYSNN